MARECGCGCGQKLGFADRRIAKQAAKLYARVEFIETYTLPGYINTATPEDVAEMEDFIEEGRGFADQMYDAAHGTSKASSSTYRAVDRPLMNQWTKAAQRIEWETKAKIVKASKEAGS